jgi:hypothetical protein
MPTRIVLDTAAIRGLIHGDAAVSALEDLHDYVAGLSIGVAPQGEPSRTSPFDSLTWMRT